MTILCKQNKIKETRYPVAGAGIYAAHINTPKPLISHQNDIDKLCRAGSCVRQLVQFTFD